MTDPKQILRSAKSVLLVDWPNPGVPRALLGAGLAVFTYSPDRYSRAEVVADRPVDADARNVLAPRDENESGYLVFRRLEARPEAVDVVNVYRPESEHAEIVAKHILPTGAKFLWLQPSVSSNSARALAEDHGLVLIEGIDIADVARSLAVG